MANRSTKPTAEKRPKAVAPIDNAQRVIRRILTPVQSGDLSLPTEQADLKRGDVSDQQSVRTPLSGTETERPVPEGVALSQPVSRTFSFVDVSGFTAYTERHGALAATDVLTRFRSACRDVTGRRGTRLAKWLGDGAMIVGTEPGPVIAATAELFLRFADDPFDIHAGIAGGDVLLFEGDDYIGKSVNLAARLCDAADSNELLCYGLDENLPEWVTHAGLLTVRASGMGNVGGVSRLQVSSDAWSDPQSSLEESALLRPTAS